MIQETGTPELRPDMPAIYRIRIQGTLDKGWGPRLAGMQVTRTTSPSGVPETVLIGEVADQSALSGILDSLHELQCPLLLVERIG